MMDQSAVRRWGVLADDSFIITPSLIQLSMLKIIKILALLVAFGVRSLLYSLQLTEAGK